MSYKQTRVPVGRSCISLHSTTLLAPVDTSSPCRKDRKVSAAPSHRPPRVAVVCEGDPSDPAEWSGTPHGIIEGLTALGVQAIPVVGAPQGRWASIGRDVVALGALRPARAGKHGLRDTFRRARDVAPLTASYGSLGTAQVKVGLRRAGHIDGVIQIGTSYGVAHARVVTFEDMTIRQAVQNDQYGWNTLSSDQVGRRIARQRRAYERAVAVAVATPWAGRSVVDDYGILPEKVKPVGLGRNRDVVAPDRVWESPRFLFVGRDWQRKNGDAVVAAFRDVRRERPDATLDVVGGHPQIDEPGVRGHGHLRLAERRDSARLDALFASATCFVMPSLFEAAGIVYLEAAACGVPSIGTTRGGAADLIGAGGVVVDPTDSEGLRRAMLAMCDATAARQAGRVAERRAEDFEWRAVAARLMEALGLPAPRVPSVAW